MEGMEQQKNRIVPALVGVGVATLRDNTVESLLTAAIKTEVSSPIPVLASGGKNELLRGHEAAVQSASPPTNTNRDNPVLQFPPSHSLTDEEKFRAEVNRWEEFYDQMHNYLLVDNKINRHTNKNISKAAVNFTIDQDGTMYYSKLTKDGSKLIRVVVIRSYAERIKVCRSIHLETGDVTLHNRRDKMLELVGCKYYWKGQRRDICQCIASCEVCSIGLGAKRKSKPPAQKRDIPHGGPPKKKRAKVEKTSKTKANASMGNNGSSTKRNDLDNILQGSTDFSASMPLSGELLLPNVIGTQAMVGEEWVEQLQTDHQLGKTAVEGETAVNLLSECLLSECETESRGDDKLSHSTLRLSSGGRDNLACGNDSLESALNFEQIFTTIDDDNGSDQASSSPLLDIEESPLSKSNLNVVQATENIMTKKVEKEATIYQLLFQLPSVSSNISPSVIEAVHMGMKETADVASCCEASDAIMRQILSLGTEYSVIISPSCASAYSIAIFASMIRLDPLSVSSQVSPNCSSPLAIVHDACCAHAQTLGSDLGPVKSCTGLTSSYNWNLGDTTYPMDRDMLKMALHSNRVAAVFYQPYAYIERSKHLSLREVSNICHSRGCSGVSVIVDATTMPTNLVNLERVVAEVRYLFEQGANMILLPSTDRFGGGFRSCVLVGVASLLSKVWRSIVLLQKQICLPLLCQPHELVAAVVAYKALQDTDGH